MCWPRVQVTIPSLEVGSLPAGVVGSYMLHARLDKARVRGQPQAAASAEAAQATSFETRQAVMLTVTPAPVYTSITCELPSAVVRAKLQTVRLQGLVVRIDACTRSCL